LKNLLKILFQQNINTPSQAFHYFAQTNLEELVSGKLHKLLIEALRRWTFIALTTGKVIDELPEEFPLDFRHDSFRDSVLQYESLPGLNEVTFKPYEARDLFHKALSFITTYTRTDQQEIRDLLLGFSLFPYTAERVQIYQVLRGVELAKNEVDSHLNFHFGLLLNKKYNPTWDTAAGVINDISKILQGTIWELGLIEWLGNISPETEKKWINAISISTVDYHADKIPLDNHPMALATIRNILRTGNMIQVMVLLNSIINGNYVPDPVINDLILHIGIDSHQKEYTRGISAICLLYNIDFNRLDLEKITPYLKARFPITDRSLDTQSVFNFRMLKQQQTITTPIAPLLFHPQQDGLSYFDCYTLIRVWYKLSATEWVTPSLWVRKNAPLDEWLTGDDEIGVMIFNHETSTFFYNRAPIILPMQPTGGTGAKRDFKMGGSMKKIILSISR
jgi:hypothetical protein